MLAALASAVPDAQAVHVVNNNAAALVLAATALAAGREIVVSRGELIEIGDGFRLPELLASTGAHDPRGRQHEPDVGGRLCRGHRAAHRIRAEGAPVELPDRRLHASAGVVELAGLGVPVVGDIGSGLLAPHPSLPDEPDAATWLRAGAALVTASGDKLLGGPQAGLLLGRADLIRRLARHPLARALRVDKLTVAALEATLTGPHGSGAAGVVGRARARSPAGPERLAAVLAAAGIDASSLPARPRWGAAALPASPLPSAAVSLPEAVAVPLRAGQQVRTGQQPAVAGRVSRRQAAARPVRGRARRRRRLAAAVVALRGAPGAGPEADAAMHVIATAGHVDHGKSALLRALTGMEPDRWAEEKRRGMTIDLGYAWMTLPSGERLAFVDVPGHARFVPNMLAGVGPVPAVLFVVAADGGWMPQSAEHLAAIDALGHHPRPARWSPGPTWPILAPRWRRRRAAQAVEPGRGAGGRGQRGHRGGPARA